MSTLSNKIKERIEKKSYEYGINEHGISNDKQYQRGYSVNGYDTGATSEATKALPLIEALEKIKDANVSPSIKLFCSNVIDKYLNDK